MLRKHKNKELFEIPFDFFSKCGFHYIEIVAYFSNKVRILFTKFEKTFVRFDLNKYMENYLA